MHRNLSIKLVLLGAIGILFTSYHGIEGSAQSQSPPVSELTTPSVPRPEYLQPTIDPQFGTRIIRVSDRARFGSSLTELRHLYATNQPWNADESYLLLNFKYPAALLDGRTYKFIRWVRQPSESVWSNLHPAVMYGTLANTNQFVKLDISKGDNYQVLKKFNEYDKIDFGGWNGNLSQDDRYAALVGLKGEKLDLLVYDLQHNRVVSRTTQPKGTTMRNHTQAKIDRIDSVSMTRSGKYVIVGYPQPGQGPRRGVQLLDRSLKFVRQLSRRGGSHFDSCVDAQGSETVVIQADTSSEIVSVQYLTGKKTTLLPANRASFNIHVSCRNLNRPGWAYISEFAGDPDPAQVTPNRTFALKLDGSKTIEQFAPPNQSRNTAYERQPFSVPNRDGRKVIFASDWGNPTDPVYAYITQHKSIGP
jgi:hypothetical protein